MAGSVRSPASRSAREKRLDDRAQCGKLNDDLVCVKNQMSPRRRKAEDVDVFAALVRVMLRCGPAELTLRAIAEEAGVTAGALVQRFGSKRALLLAHARRAAATGDIGFGAERDDGTASPLQTLRSAAEVHARLAESPRAALRNLAYLQNDLADPPLRRHLLRLKRTARARYEQLLAAALAAGELRADTDVQSLARMIEVTLDGSFLAWTLYREGAAAEWLREDFEAMLRPYLARGRKRTG
jgi:AcrR family transcriptional regulator